MNRQESLLLRPMWTNMHVQFCIGLYFVHSWMFYTLKQLSSPSSCSDALKVKLFLTMFTSVLGLRRYETSKSYSNYSWSDGTPVTITAW